MFSEEGARPWLRTLPDEKAADAIELIGCTLRALPQHAARADFSRDGSLVLIVDAHEFAAEVVRVGWSGGCLTIGKDDRCRSPECADHRSRKYGSMEIEDTPSTARRAHPIRSLRSIVDRLEHWLEGLRSPFHAAPPEHHEARISAFLDKLAIAVHGSEPDFDYLHLEPCRGDLDRIIMLVFDNGIKDIGIGIGTAAAEDELHPVLAADILDIMSRYTEVRENDWRRDDDLRIHIGDMGIRSLEAVDAVGLLRLHGRCRSQVPLYADPKR